MNEQTQLSDLSGLQEHLIQLRWLMKDRALQIIRQVKKT